MLIGGDASAPKSASPGPMPGDATRLLFGAVRVRALVVEGSISSSVRNDVCSSSGFVLVMVTKKSSRSFCSARGVPFKSIIYRREWVHKASCDKCTRVLTHLLKVGKRRIADQKSIVKDKALGRVLSTA